MQSKNVAYVERLDHLRFFAAALVVLFHSSLFTGDFQKEGFKLALVDQGHVGVQFFMVISGFILGLISFGKDISTLQFYWNRVLRIYPLLVVVVALGYYSHSLEGSASGIFSFLAAISPLSNLTRLQYGEFGGQMWSIAVELQFYLLFPLFHEMLKKGPLYHLSVILFLIAIRSIVFTLHGTTHGFTFFTIFGELDVFLIGHLCGWLYKQGKLRFFNPWWLLGSFILVNATVFIFFHEGLFYHVAPPGNSPENSNWLWIWYLDAIGLLFAVLLISYLQATIRIPLSSLLAALGRFSYSIYVWHMVVVELYLKMNFQLPSYLSGLLILFLTIPLSWASYHLIEAPFLAKRVRYILSGNGVRHSTT